MNILERIAANAVRIVGNFSESALACSFLVSVFSIASVVGIRSIISGLMEMHRSKSALKKLNKEYSFGQKMLLKHAWQECLHAKKFCRFLIIWHHCVLALFFVALLLAVLSNIWPVIMPVIGWCTLGLLVLVFFPVYTLVFMLERYPFRKFKKEFRFRKYHNTNDHDSLW